MFACLKKTLIILTCFVLPVAGKQVLAQSTGLSPQAQPQVIIKNQYQNKYMYKNWVERAKVQRHNNFPFYKLVIPYSNGPDYDPYAKTTTDKLYEYAYTASTSDDPQSRRDAADHFQMLLEDHLGNFDVVSAAVPLVRQNVKLGDLEFLTWLRSGLAKRAIHSGHGLDLYSAKTIYSAGEETMIIRHMKVDIIDTETITDGTSFYHIHHFEDLYTGRPGKLYIDFTPIMRGEIKEKSIENPGFQYEPMPFE